MGDHVTLQAADDRAGSLSLSLSFSLSLSLSLSLFLSLSLSKFIDYYDIWKRLEEKEG